MHHYIYISTYLRSFAILAWSLSRLCLEKADEVLGIPQFGIRNSA